MSRHPDETQLAAFVMGELTGESERSQTPLEAPVQGHLRTCADCQAAVTRLREVVAVSDRVAGRAITEVELSKAHEALLERLRRERIPADRPARRRFRPLLRWLAPSLAAAVCVASSSVVRVVLTNAPKLPPLGRLRITHRLAAERVRRHGGQDVRAEGVQPFR